MRCCQVAPATHNLLLTMVTWTWTDHTKKLAKRLQIETHFDDKFRFMEIVKVSDDP